jgi:hypothetical protein
VTWRGSPAGKAPRLISPKLLIIQHYLKIAQGKGYSTDRFVKNQKKKERKKTNNNAAFHAAMEI